MFVGQSDEFWEKHCEKDFRGARRNEEDFETWRELYLVRILKFLIKFNLVIFLEFSTNVYLEVFSKFS